MKTLRPLIIIGATLQWLLAVSLRAATLYVWPGNPSPGTPYDSWNHAAQDIQTAVNAASPGDTVLVTNGIYATGGAITPGYALWNRVAIPQPITLQSVNGPYVTLIQGQGPLGPGAMRCLYLTNGASLSGFTLTNGCTLTNGDSYYDRRGGGIFLDGGGVISNCVVAGNTAHNMGGGVYGQLGGNILASLIQGNQALSYAGGIYLYSTNLPVVVQNCQIISNWANIAGGVRFWSNGVALHCVIGGNWATNRAGGIAFEYSGTLTNCTVTSNSVTAGNGGGVWMSGPVTLSGSHFWSNSASVYGGGVCGNGTLSIDSMVTNCDFLWNQANAGAAAAICPLVNCDVRTNQGIYAALCYCTALGTTLSANTGYFGGAANNSWLTNCTIVNNVANGDGGGVDVSILDTCTVMGNHAAYHGGGASYSSVVNSLIVSNSCALAGGGIYNSASSNYLVANSQIMDNQAGTDGGGIHVDSGAAVLNSFIISNQCSSSGGGLSVSNCGLIANCQILSNAATNGSGGGVWSADASGIISNCVVNQCVAGVFGGGIYQGAVLNCQISSNTAGSENGALFSNQGGGTYDSQVFDSTLTGNFAYEYGGGAYGGTLRRCNVFGNVCGDRGGGASDCTVYDSLFVANSATNGGAIFSCTLYGCTLTSNSASEWGGANYGTLYNSIACGNSGGDLSGTAYFSCAPELTAGVNGNITDAPVFANPAAADYTLNLGSPCINAGTNFDWMTNDTDLAGSPRILGGRVDMGAYEFNSLLATGAVTSVWSADYTSVAPSGMINFTAAVAGRATGCRWQWDDGTSVSNLFNAGHAFSTLGTHTVIFAVWNLDATNTVAFTITVLPPATHYVSLAGTHTPPFTNWPSAATNIQAAIDAALPGDSVLVASGIYSNGGALDAGATNVVSLNKSPLSVSSLSGPAQTIILCEPNLWISGPERGAFVGTGTLLAGFTISNGVTANAGGGGVWCDAGGAVSNCIIIGNTVIDFSGSTPLTGGGVWNQGTLTDCLIANNFSDDSGGGVSGGTLVRCQLTNNFAYGTYGYIGYGGGVENATLYDCLIVSNTAGSGDYSDGYGGGASGGALHNCTVVGNNVISSSSGAMASGTDGSDLWNCIIYDNTGADNDVEGGSVSYTCMPTLSVAGIGNFTNAPLFMNAAAGDFRLAAGSPCINAGTNQDWMAGTFDLAGNPRIAGGTVDLGAYEYQGGGLVSIGFSMLTDPLRLQLQWLSVTDTSYQFQSSTNLSATNWLNEGMPIPGTGGILTNDFPIGVDSREFFRLQILGNGP